MNWILYVDRNCIVTKPIRSFMTKYCFHCHYYKLDISLYCLHYPTPRNYFVRDSVQNHHPLPGHHHQLWHHVMTTTCKTKRSRIATITILCISSRWHRLMLESGWLFVWNKQICSFAFNCFVTKGLIQVILFT